MSVIIPASVVVRGRVLMRHDDAGNWTVTKPDGSVLNTAGTTTQGLQEAWNFAWANLYLLDIYGGGTTGNATITCTTTVNVPTGRGNAAIAEAVTFIGPTAGDFFNLDSEDFTFIDFRDSEIVAPSAGAAVHYNPATNNGENFAGFTSSIHRWGTIVVTTNLFAPDPSRGTGLKISTPALGLGLANGNGLMTGMEISVVEINAGAVGWQNDNPGGAGSTNSGNDFTAYIHAQGTTAFSDGTSAITGLSFNNTLHLRLNSAATGLSVWGQNHLVEVQVEAGTNGIVMNSSASKNLVLSARNSAATPWTDNSTAKDNIRLDASSGKFWLGASPSSTAPFNVRAAADENFTMSGPVSLADGVSFSSVNDANNANKGLEFRASAMSLSVLSASLPVKTDASNKLISQAIAASELSDYSTGTWTPADNSGAGLAFTISSATYVKVGKMVIAVATLTYPVTASGANASISGLPFASDASRSAIPMFTTNGTLGMLGIMAASSSNFAITNILTAANITNAQLSGVFVSFTVGYKTA